MRVKLGPVKLGVVGVGKIVRDQHLPVLADHPAFELVAAASRNATVDGVDNFPSIEAMLETRPDIEAVALCMPPQARHAPARAALLAGKHTLLEKPPGATLAELEDLRQLAATAGVSLYATWHSRHAAAVERARTTLAERRLLSARITWKEDVRRWHPGQAWIWEPGGLGVFDPGVNALSIATHVLPRPFVMTASTLYFPENRAAPIAADLEWRDLSGATISAAFDWRQTGPQTWTIEFETAEGLVALSDGGARLSVDGAEQMAAPDTEYRAIYDRFAEIIASGASDFDLSPMHHVADAFLLGRRETVEPFED